MTATEVHREAASRLRRATEFMSLATLAEGDPAYANSVVSLCAQAGIAASDAVLLVSSARDRRARAGHEQAPSELRRIGEDALASRLSRLLRLKPKAQYTAGAECTMAEASAALRDARRLLEIATQYVNGKANE